MKLNVKIGISVKKGKFVVIRKARLICLLLNAGLNVEEVGQAAPNEQGGDDEEKTAEHSGDRGEQPCRKGDSLEKSAEYRDPGVNRDHRAEEE